MARWVTPYGREALWFSNNSVAIPLLTSEEALGGTPRAGRKSMRNSSGFLALKVTRTNKELVFFLFFWDLFGLFWEEMRFLNILLILG